MIEEKTLYGYDDLVIQPCPSSPVSSRSECRVLHEDGFLPVFASPMYSVVDNKSIPFFKNAGIHPILPRGMEADKNSPPSFRAVSLSDFIRQTEDGTAGDIPVCIDIANGHMEALHSAVTKSKQKCPDTVVMAGNVASADAYERLCDAGADYIRVGIGTGGRCTTSCLCGVHTPMASLIDECSSRGRESAVVADGGVRGHADIIKALALGADYVMCGGVLNKALESAGKTYRKRGLHPAAFESMADPVDQHSDDVLEMFLSGRGTYIKEHYGMSTRRAQRMMGVRDHVPEGIESLQEVSYTLARWRHEFIHHLSTAMSYTGKKNLAGFIGGVVLRPVTSAGHGAFWK